MSPSEETKTIRRKLAAGRADARTGKRSALGALRLGLARAARDLLDLPVLVVGATQDRATQDSLSEHFGDDQLLLLMEGPGGRVGALAADRDTLAALIQQQTMNRVTKSDPGDRPFTSTDAAMLAPLIEAAIRLSSRLTEVQADRALMEGFRYGYRIENMRALLLALDADRFRVFHLVTEFSGGVRQGELWLALPEEIKRPPEKPGRKAAPPMLDRSVKQARAELNAVMGRISVTLAELTNMQEGDLLPLCDMDLTRADLIAIDGSKVANVRLGQSGGLRAVRLNEASADPPGVAPALSFEPDDMAPPDEMALPDDGAMPEMGAMPDLPGQDVGGLPALWDGDDAAGTPDLMDGFPAMDADADADAALSDGPELATAMDIADLAGLDLGEPDEGN